jgi:8-oxo-dGTP pyrophosphatase MutT (NUDIX family)
VLSPSYGDRNLDLSELLARSEPAESIETVWGNGTLPLRITAYTSPARLPIQLVVSVRCVVRCGDRVVICQEPDGKWMLLPGGRREPGEALQETVIREVHEETGWIIEASSLSRIGWMHFEHQQPPPAGHPYPHPDFLNVVFVGDVLDCDSDHNLRWVDTDGYIQRSEAVPVSEAHRLVVTADRLAGVFLEAATT